MSHGRCQPGDIAIFVCGQNLGKLVHIDRAFIGEEDIGGTLFRKMGEGPSWVVTSLGGLLFNLMADDDATYPKGHFTAPFNERALRPLRNPKGEDQALNASSRSCQTP